MSSSSDEGVIDPFVRVEDKGYRAKKKKRIRLKDLTEAEKAKPKLRLNTSIVLKTKQNLIRSYKIPKTVFQKAQILANFPEPAIKSAKINLCHPYIQNVHSFRRKNVRGSQTMQLLRELRTHVLQRDWISFMRVLSIARPYTQNESSTFFPLMVRYTLICLAHNRGLNLLDDFLQGVASCVTEEDKLALFKEMTRLYFD